jgi:hypothetical protein
MGNLVNIEVNLSVLDWKSGWTRQYSIEQVEEDVFKKSKEVLDEVGNLVTTKSKDVELEIEDWDIYLFLSKKTKKKFVSYVLEGDEVSVGEFVRFRPWPVKKAFATFSPNQEFKFRPNDESLAAGTIFDSNPRVSWKINGTEYYALKFFDASGSIVEKLYSKEGIEQALSRKVFTLTKQGGNWKDWEFFVCSSEVDTDQAIACFAMGGTRIYINVDGNAPAASAKALRYSLENLFRCLWSKGTKNIPTDGWARWIVEQCLIHGLSDFQMLEDKFTFDLNMSEAEQAEFRVQMLQPWKFPDNNRQYEITGED